MREPLRTKAGLKRHLNRYIFNMRFLLSFLSITLIVLVVRLVVSTTPAPDNVPASTTPAATATATPDTTMMAIRNASTTWVIFLGDQPRSQGGVNVVNSLIGTKYMGYRIVEILSFYEFIHPGNVYSEIYVTVRLAEDK